MKFMNCFKVVNKVFRGQINLFFNLFDCYCLLQVFFDNISYNYFKPRQIVIRYNNFTCLIFTSGQVRFMGNCNDDLINNFINHIDIIYTHIIVPFNLVSETVVTNLHRNVNLFHFAQIKHDFNIKCEPELFHAVSLLHWSPIHVNLFHSGKIVPLVIEFINKHFTF